MLADRPSGAIVVAAGPAPAGANVTNTWKSPEAMPANFPGDVGGASLPERGRIA